MTRIEEFGWRKDVEPGIGRIVSAHGDYYHLVCNEQPTGEILARKKKSAFVRMKSVAPDNMKAARFAKRANQTFQPPNLPTSQLPITGDFVRFRYNAQGDSMILETLPRFSHFERKDPTARRTSQTLAVNFDTLFVMMSMNENFSTARIERYLELAEDLGEAEVIVVVTKMDLTEPGDEAYLKELEEVVDGRARILKISSLDGTGVSSLGTDEDIFVDESYPFKCMFVREEKIKSGQRVSIRLLEDMLVGNTLIPKNSHLMATCSIGGRLELEISNVEIQGRIFTLGYEAYDTDGTKGIYCPDSGGNVQQTARSRGTTLAGTALRSRVGRVAGDIVSTGISLIESSNGERTVTVPSGYEFFIVRKKNP